MKYTDDVITAGDAAYKYLLSHVQLNGAQLWLQGAGQERRLYLRRSLLQPSRLQQRTGVG